MIISIGNNIRYLRTQHGLSQEDLAEKLGYKSYTTITKWESGVSEPTLKKASEIASFFNLSVLGRQAVSDSKCAYGTGCVYGNCSGRGNPDRRFFY